MNFKRYAFYCLVLFLLSVFVLRVVGAPSNILIFTYTVFPGAIVVFILLDKQWNKRK